MSNSKSQLKGALILLSTSVIWGSAFVAQSEGIKKIDAFTFNGIRTVIGALFLFIFILIRDAVTGRRLTEQEKALRKKGNKSALVYGSILGVALCAASNFQQFAFYETTSGKIAFITALYMFFVPLIGLFFRKRISVIIWISILIAFAGLYLLCIDPSMPFTVNRGDALALACAFLFSIQILLVEKFAPLADGLKISCVEFAVCGVLSCILMFIFERPVMSDILDSWLPILYAGIMSTGIAYTLQIVGQKYCEATVASLMMCMESVFALISAAIILKEIPTAREGIGCAVMFIAILISQLAEPLINKIKLRRQK
ncbi:MAG: DMT family transporter [Clostridia bacterium]|nr:DMT family transporter [Clostridia bacterium]